MKKKPQNIDPPITSPEEAAIADWVRKVKFKKKLFGGIDEIDVWHKIDELNNLYEKLLIARSGVEAAPRSAAGEGDRSDE